MAHYDNFDPAAVILNTVWRILPGLTIYLVISFIIIVTWSISFFVQLAPYFSEFETFQNSFFAMLTQDLKIVDIHSEFINGAHPHKTMLMIAQFIQTSFQVVLGLGAVALTVNLYKEAMKFEKPHCAPDPEKVSFYN